MSLHLSLHIAFSDALGKRHHFGSSRGNSVCKQCVKLQRGWKQNGLSILGSSAKENIYQSKHRHRETNWEFIKEPHSISERTREIAALVSSHRSQVESSVNISDVQTRGKDDPAIWAHSGDQEFIHPSSSKPPSSLAFPSTLCSWEGRREP